MPACPLPGLSGRLAMVGRTVIDSGVIAAIFFPEDLTARALDDLKWKSYLTVDIALADAAHVAAKRVLSRKGNPGDVKEMLSDAIAFIGVCDPVPSGELIDPAFDLACELDIPLYDALFVAAAVRERGELFTADKELAVKAKKVCRVRLLE